MLMRSGYGAVRYGLPGLVLGLALAWVCGGGRGPSARAQSAPAGADRARPAESGGTLAFTAPGQGSSQMLYLIDTRARAFAVYRVDPANPKATVKLEAARQYHWDLRLTEYNNAPPEVTAIESTVKALGPPAR